MLRQVVLLEEDGSISALGATQVKQGHIKLISHMINVHLCSTFSPFQLLAAIVTKQDSAPQDLSAHALASQLGLLMSKDISNEQVRQQSANVWASFMPPSFPWLSSISTQLLNEIIDQVFQQHADVVAKVHAGQRNSAAYLLGEVLRRANSQQAFQSQRPNPKIVKSIVEQRLASKS